MVTSNYSRAHPLSLRIFERFTVHSSQGARLSDVALTRPDPRMGHLPYSRFLVQQDHHPPSSRTRTPGMRTLMPSTRTTQKNILPIFGHKT